MALATESSLREKEGKERGLQERSGGGRRGWVIACLPVLSLCTGGSVCWWVLLHFEECLLAGVTVCLSQGSGLSWCSRPLCVLGSMALGTPSCVPCADAADVAGPSCACFPERGRGAAICSPIMAAKCQGGGTKTEEVGLGPGQPQPKGRNERGHCLPQPGSDQPPSPLSVLGSPCLACS